MTRGILLAVLLAFSFSTVSIAAPAYTVIANASNAPAKTKKAKAVVKKEEKKEAPVTYKKPTRKKVVKK
jgi:hypothetical protein